LKCCHNDNKKIICAKIKKNIIIKPKDAGTKSIQRIVQENDCETPKNTEAEDSEELSLGITPELDGILARARNIRLHEQEMIGRDSKKTKQRSSKTARQKSTSSQRMCGGAETQIQRQKTPRREHTGPSSSVSGQRHRRYSEEKKLEEKTAEETRKAASSLRGHGALRQVKPNSAEKESPRRPSSRPTAGEQELERWRCRFTSAKSAWSDMKNLEVDQAKLQKHVQDAKEKFLQAVSDPPPIQVDPEFFKFHSCQSAEGIGAQIDQKCDDDSEENAQSTTQVKDIQRQLLSFFQGNANGKWMGTSPDPSKPIAPEMEQNSKNEDFERWLNFNQAIHICDQIDTLLCYTPEEDQTLSQEDISMFKTDCEYLVHQKQTQSSCSEMATEDLESDNNLHQPFCLHPIFFKDAGSLNQARMESASHCEAFCSNILSNAEEQIGQILLPALQQKVQEVCSQSIRQALVPEDWLWPLIVFRTVDALLTREGKPGICFVER